MIVWNNWNAVTKARGSGINTFKRKGPAMCRLCFAIVKNIQSLSWHMKKEHGR